MSGSKYPKNIPCNFESLVRRLEYYNVRGQAPNDAQGTPATQSVYNAKLLFSKSDNFFFGYFDPGEKKPIMKINILRGD